MRNIVTSDREQVRGRSRTCWNPIDNDVMMHTADIVMHANSLGKPSSHVSCATNLTNAGPAVDLLPSCIVSWINKTLPSQLTANLPANISMSAQPCSVGFTGAVNPHVWGLAPAPVYKRLYPQHLQHDFKGSISQLK